MKKTIETTFHIRILTGILLLLLIIILMSFSIELQANIQQNKLLPQQDKLSLQKRKAEVI